MSDWACALYLPGATTAEVAHLIPGFNWTDFMIIIPLTYTVQYSGWTTIKRGLLGILLKNEFNTP